MSRGMGEGWADSYALSLLLSRATILTGFTPGADT